MQGNSLYSNLVERVGGSAFAAESISFASLSTGCWPSRTSTTADFKSAGKRASRVRVVLQVYLL